MAPQREIVFVGTSTGLFRCAHTASGWNATPLRTGASISRITAFDSSMLLIIEGEDTSWQTFDGGATWQEGGAVPTLPAPPLVQTVHGPATLPNPRLSLAIAYARLPDRNGTLLGAGANGMLLFRSDDEGIHWEPAAAPLDAGRIAALVPSAHQPATAWAGTERGAILRTANAGITWAQVLQVEGAVLALAPVADDNTAD